MVRKSALWIIFFGLFCLSITTTGCSSNGWVPQWIGSGFIRKEFLDYRRVAALPFEGDPKGEASVAFAQAFRERFPQIEFVGQGELLKGFSRARLAFRSVK